MLTRFKTQRVLNAALALAVLAAATHVCGHEVAHEMAHPGTASVVCSIGNPEHGGHCPVPGGGGCGDCNETDTPAHDDSGRCSCVCDMPGVVASVTTLSRANLLAGKVVEPKTSPISGFGIDIEHPPRFC
jgi:hypothetical protein